MNLIALLITTFTLVVIFGIHLYRKARVGPQTKGSKSGSQFLLARLSEETTVLGSSIDVLCELSEEYFISINSNGFPELCKIHEALKATVNLCTELDSAKDQERLDEILRYVHVQRGKEDVPRIILHSINEDLIQNLENWDERLAEILLRITDGIQNSSNSLKSVGRYRTSKKHNTTQMLNELVGMVRR